MRLAASRVFPFEATPKTGTLRLKNNKGDLRPLELRPWPTPFQVEVAPVQRTWSCAHFGG